MEDTFRVENRFTGGYCAKCHVTYLWRPGPTRKRDQAHCAECDGPLVLPNDETRGERGLPPLTITAIEPRFER